MRSVSVKIQILSDSTLVKVYFFVGIYSYLRYVCEQDCGDGAGREATHGDLKDVRTSFRFLQEEGGNTAVHRRIVVFLRLRLLLDLNSRKKMCCCCCSNDDL